MDGWRSDEDHSVCRDSSWNQQSVDILQVLGILLQRDVLSGVFICETEDGTWCFKTTAVQAAKNVGDGNFLAWQRSWWSKTESFEGISGSVYIGCTSWFWQVVPSSEQSLVPKKTVTADMLSSAGFWPPISRGKRILAHLELYPDSPLLTTSHFLETQSAHPVWILWTGQLAYKPV